MNQDIIALLIVASALGYTLYKVVKSLTTKQEGLCGDGCSGCTIKHEIKKSMKNKAKRKIPKDLKLAI